MVVRELAARGHEAYDLDTPEWSEWIDADPSDGLTPAQGKDWVWRLDRVGALLSKPGGGTLFISGCAENMGQLLPMIDTVILLAAPVDTILQRLAARSPGGYGHVAEERRKVAALTATIEPLLRQSADHEIEPGNRSAQRSMRFFAWSMSKPVTFGRRWGDGARRCDRPGLALPRTTPERRLRERRILSAESR